MKNLIPVTALVVHGDIHQTVIIYVKRTALPVTMVMIGSLIISLVMTASAIALPYWSTFKDSVFNTDLNWGLWTICREYVVNGQTFKECQDLFQPIGADRSSVVLEWTSHDETMITVIKGFLLAMLVCVLAAVPLVFLSHRKSNKFGMWMHLPLGLWLALYLTIIGLYLTLDVDALYGLQGQKMAQFLGAGFWLHITAFVPILLAVTLFWSSNYICVSTEKYDRDGNLLAPTNDESIAQFIGKKEGSNNDIV
ncbi:hypothetical protein SARC_06140, partial [Sphaeroforma arctica JP610]